jgi:hypothetical protein
MKTEKTRNEDACATQPSVEVDGHFSMGADPLPREYSPGINGDGAIKPAVRSGEGGVRILSITWSQFPGCVSEDASPLEPILTLGAAARALGMSRKRLSNLITDEKARLGKLPDFVCDASGKMRRRIDGDELVAWVRSRRRKVGRPSKLMKK